MSDFIDPFPNLPRAIDVGGDRYFMGPEKPIELGFKSRKNYLDTFGSDRRTEYLLRKYLFLSLVDKKRLKFDPPGDKNDLIQVLKKRANQLKESQLMNSSTLKNTIFQRSYLNIQALIQEFEGPEFKGLEFPKMPDISVINPFDCQKAKKYVREIPQDKLFEIILEISWYLLHPDQVPSKIQCEWMNLIKQLDTLRLGDIAAEIKGAEVKAGIKPSEQAFNYFKKINLGKVAKADKLENALDQAKRLALEIQGESANEKVKDRLKSLLDILEMKKYLSNTLEVDPDRMKIIDSNAENQIRRNMPQNPMRGGASKTLDKPLGIAMEPLFEYFRVVFDPIYSFVESNLATYAQKSQTNKSMKKVIIPQLTTLLHICNSLNPKETTEGGQNSYGIYRLKNVDPEIINFINSMLKSTEMYLTTIPEDKDKRTFNEQLFKLPKVRLSTFVNKFTNYENNKVYKDPDSIPSIQFLSVGGNVTLMPEDVFMTSKKTNGVQQEQVFKAINELFVPTDLYILCTKSENIMENIPTAVYEIDFDSVDISKLGMDITTPDNYFNKNKDAGLHLENFVNLTEYDVFNDAELALSIFISFKELMPTQ
jgi:hypothetical protein